MSHRQTSPHVRAAEASARHIGRYILITLEQLLWRALCLSPLVYAMVSGQFFGLSPKYAPIAAVFCCLFLWLILVLPARFRMGAQLSGWFSADIGADSWSDRLAQGLKRLAVTLPFLLPLAAYLAYMYYTINLAPVTEFLMLLISAGQLVGGDFTIGTVLLLLLLALLALLAAWGWRKYMMPHFYLRLDGEDKSKSRRPLAGVIFRNFLLVLPALAIVLALLTMSKLPENPQGITDIVRPLLSVITEFDFPAGTLIQCLWVLVIAYLPFVVLRKAAIAAALHPGLDQA